MICLNKKRVLHILSALDFGGVEIMLYNYYKYIDHDRISFDFIVYSQKIGKMEEIFESLGSAIYHVTPKKESFVKNSNDIAKVIRNGNYDVVHVHQGFSSFNSLIISKLNRVPLTIVHNHGVKTFSGLKKPLYKILQFLNLSFSDWRFACSEEAGKNLCGKKWNLSNKCFLMNNAIEVDKYAYNQQTRENIRNILDVQADNFLVLHAGRMDDAKNQSFLIDVFKKICEKHSNSTLLLIGDGPLKQKLHEKAEVLGLSDKVKFLSVVENLYDYYQAADVFVFPSKHEGLGMVAIEAQVSGLPVVCSTGVPKSVELTNNVVFLNLNDGLDVWCDQILSTRNMSRKDNTDIVKNAGYDVVSAADKYKNWVLLNGDIK